MTSARVVPVDEQLLRAWPLPRPEPDGDKETRGRAVVIAGSTQIPGAALLAGEAALRAGAGKLNVATAAGVAAGIALRLPEARVLAVPETSDGALALGGLDAVTGIAAHADALLVGPGLQGEAASRAFVRELVARLRSSATCPLILDALAMGAIDAVSGRPVLLTPHAGEMAHLTGASKEAVCADMENVARSFAARWNAVVALKGPTTWIAAPDGSTWRHDGGNVGLATSGSGDVLAGIILGLAARGAPLEQAAVWGVAMHSLAGDALAARLGAIGYLASELPREVPRLMQWLA